ncbi:MAG: glycosyltransferase family 2 protein [Elusimicrobia bacterium]|nr:glycosyltransferase family 2 protein [Elusimicrobiota bacterium]
MKLSVVIPSYNEANTILSILHQVVAIELDKEIILVDDASRDNTRNLVEKADIPGLKYFRLDKQSGKSAAVRRGIAEASGDFIIVQDADLEYNPKDIIKLLKASAENEGAVVYGNRFPFGKKKMFGRQYLANRFLTVLTNFLYFAGVGDLETCYKLIPADVLKSMDLKENRFGIEAEITAKLLRSGHKIISVPIEYNPRGYAEGKKIKFMDFVQALLILLKERVRPRPRKNFPESQK